jgi:hypothetical protein
MFHRLYNSIPRALGKISWSISRGHTHTHTHTHTQREYIQDKNYKIIAENSLYTVPLNWFWFGALAKGSK